MALKHVIAQAFETRIVVVKKRDQTVTVVGIPAEACLGRWLEKGSQS
jgi:hypothetical protein